MINLNMEELSNLVPLSINNNGKYGICYKYNCGVLKIFYTDIDLNILNNINNNLKRQSNIILYPKEKLYINNQMKGYYTSLAPGISLDNLSFDIMTGKKDLSFDSFLSIYYDKFLPSIIKEDVLLDDLKLEHTFIDDNFYFIDTDLYKENDKTISNRSAKELNLSNLNFFVFNYFIYSFTDENLYIKDNYKEDYIERMINNIKNKTNCYVDSFGKLNSYKF